MADKHLFFETAVGKKFQQFMNIIELNGFNDNCKTEYEDLLFEMDKAVWMIEGYSTIVMMVALHQTAPIPLQNFVDATTEVVVLSEQALNKLEDVHARSNFVQTHSGSNTIN